jgi:restriction system protein
MIGLMLVEERGTQIPQSDGLAFEQQCETSLREAGFLIERTPASSDYGVDIIARRHGLSYAIQCKCHKVPVGVSAVQEAAAGRNHYMTDYAIVVATSGFTAQARKLAQSNSVLLITVAQLGILEELVRAADTG